MRSLQKWVCLLLVLAALMECSPITALAESQGMITAEEAAAAWALTGLDDDAASYRAGMAFSSQMNAHQLSCWLDEMLDEEMAALQHMNSEMENSFGDMKLENPSLYAQMTTGSNAGYYQKLLEDYHQAENLRQLLRYNRDRLTEASGAIRNYAGRLSDPDSTRSQKLTASYYIREAVQTIRDIRADAAENQQAWQNSIRQMQNSLWSPARNSLKSKSASGYSDWLDAVRNWDADRKQPVQITASASSLYPDKQGTSLLARLSPVSRALADTSETATVTFMDKDSVAIKILGPNDKAFQNATVTIVKLDNSSVSFTEQTDKNGTVILSANPFSPDAQGNFTASVEVKAEGYKSFQIKKQPMRKGETQTYYLEKLPADSKTPYVYSASFDGHDILKSEYQAYYSPHNDKKFSLEIVTSAPAKVTICYNPDADGRYLKKELKTESGNLTASWTDTLKSILTPGKTIKIITEDLNGASKDEVRLPLKMVRGVFDSPLSNVGSLLTNSFGIDQSLFGSATLGLNIPSDRLPSPLTGLNITAGSGLEKFLVVRGIADLDGSFMVFAGGIPDKYKDQFKTEWSKELWKREDPADTARIQNTLEEDQHASAEGAENGNMPADRTQTTQSPFLGKFKMSIAAFGMFSGKFNYTGKYPDENPNWNNYEISGLFAGGVQFTFGASFSWKPHPLITVTAEISLGLTVGLSGGFTSVWDEKAKERKAVGDWNQTGMTLIIRLQLTISLTLGWKGIAEVTISGYGYLKFVFFLGYNPSIKVFGGFGLSIRVEIFAIVSVSLTLWDSGDFLLYSTDTSKAEARPWYALLLANAKAEDDTPREMPQSSMLPEDYAALVPASSVVLSDLAMASPNLRFAELNGVPFVFYIAPAADGKPATLTWTNLKTGASQNIWSFPSVDGDRSRHDYSFDVQVVTSLPEWSSVLHPFYKVQDKNRDIGMLAVASASGFTETAVEGGAVKTPNDTIVRYVIFTEDGGSLTNVMAVGKPDGTSFPDMKENTWEAFRTERPMGNIKLGLYQKLQETANNIPVLISFILADDAVGQKSEIDHTLLLRSTHIFYVNIVNTTTQYHLLDQEENSGDPWTQIETADDPEPFYAAVQNRAPTYVLKENQLGRWDADQSVLPLAEGNIAFFHTLADTENLKQRTVFYLEAEHPDQEAANGAGEDTQVVYHLKAASLDYDIDMHTMREDISVTNVDLDVTIPTTAFHLQNINNTQYLYWLELAPKEKDSDPDIYRLRGVVFDPDALVTSDDFVLVQFAPAQAGYTPANIFLTEESAAYYTLWNGDEQNGGKATIYSFPFRTIPHTDLTGMAAPKGVVVSGTDMDVHITLLNDGNANINTLDLEVVLEDDDGNVIKNADGTDMIIETLHADLLNPDQSTRVVNVGGEGSATGSHTIYRRAELPDAPVQSVFNVTRTKTVYKDYGGNKYTQKQEGAPDTQTTVSKHLLPGQKATFTASVHVPADWSKTKHVTVRLAKNQNKTMKGTANAIMTYGEDSVRLNHDTHDIDIKHRLYPGPNGEDYLSIVIYDHSETEESLRLYAELYLDDAETPDYIELPYSPEHVSSDMAQTIDLSVSALLGGRSARKVRVVIRGVGIEERSLIDNEFTLYLNDAFNPLRIAVQPTDQTALEGGTAEFFVVAAGGTAPYSYQWQESMGKDLGWRDIPDAVKSVLTVEDAKASMNGRQYRCVVTDHHLDEIISDSAALHVVSSLPPTGDHTSLPLYLALAAASLLLAAALRRTRKRREQK